MEAILTDKGTAVIICYKDYSYSPPTKLNFGVKNGIFEKLKSYDGVA